MYKLSPPLSWPFFTTTAAGWTIMAEGPPASGLLIGATGFHWLGKIMTEFFAFQGKVRRGGGEGGRGIENSAQVHSEGTNLMLVNKLRFFRLSFYSHIYIQILYKIK
jgi:hypothetical protein